MLDAEAAPATLVDRAAEQFARFRAGDAEAMSDLVALVTPILWHAVRAQRLDAATSEDVLQTTWLALVRNASSISEPRAVVRWLIVSARREAWRVSRSQSRVTPHEITDDDVVVTVDDAPEEITLRTDRERRLWTHISALPERCRQLLRVIAFADKPDYAELARSMGMPIGSIGPTRGRCLGKLRAALAADAAWEA